MFDEGHFFNFGKWLHERGFCGELKVNAGRAKEGTEATTANS